MTTTPHPQGESLLAVEQVDREAALGLVPAYWAPAWPGRVMGGEYDANPVVQAFARHRLASTPREAGAEAMREAVARKLCEQHGGDPDAVATEEHDCWEGPLWTAFTSDADAILALARPSPAPSEDSASSTDGAVGEDVLPQPSDMATALALTATPETFPHDSYNLAVWLDKALATPTPAIPATSTGGDEVELRAHKLTMPNGNVLTCDYPDAPDWARSWTTQAPDGGISTQDQDWEIVEEYGLTALFAALTASSTSGLTDGGDVARAERDRVYAIKWANQSVDMLKDAFFPVADALRALELYLRDTPHHNAIEAAAARKALARFDAPDVAALAQPDAVTSGMPDRGEGR